MLGLVAALCVPAMAMFWMKKPFDWESAGRLAVKVHLGLFLSLTYSLQVVKFLRAR
jgi:hypothetical protein